MYITHGLECLHKKNFAGLTDEEKDNLVLLLKDLIDFFDKEFGVTLFPCFGTLLGTIRQQDFIPQDNDIDVTYFSKKKTRQEVLREIQEINKRLIELGYMRYVKAKWKCNGYALGQALIKYKGMNFELSVAWDEGRLRMWNYSKNVGKAKDMFPFKEVKLRKEKIKVPKNAEYLLTCLYGDWETPKQEKARQYQGFNWTLWETASQLPAYHLRLTPEELISMATKHWRFKRLKKIKVDNEWHDEDVHTHSLKVAENMIKLTSDNVMIFTALYHDIGKVKENHEKEGSKIVRELLQKIDFGFNYKETEKICRLIEKHTWINDILDPNNKKLEKNLIIFKQDPLWKELLMLGYADMLDGKLKERNPESYNFRKKHYDIQMA